jgi:hypothetical protein
LSLKKFTAVRIVRNSDPTYIKFYKLIIVVKISV